MNVALDYTTKLHLFSCFLDITFIVFHSMNSQSRSWILLCDKYHRWRNGPVPMLFSWCWHIWAMPLTAHHCTW